MTTPAFSRRTMVKKGAAMAGLSMLRLAGPAHAFQADRGRGDPLAGQAGGQPGPGEHRPQLDGKLDDWITRTTSSSSSSTSTCPSWTRRTGTWR